MTDSHQDQINRLYDVIEKRDVEIAERDIILKKLAELIDSDYFKIAEFETSEKYGVLLDKINKL